VEPSCETKPVSRLRIADWEQTYGGTPPAACRPGPARAGCTNKPNWPEPIVQNEPNFRGGRPRHPEPVVRNKANWPWWRPRPSPPPQENRRYRTRACPEPVERTPNPRRTEGRSCETNPIWHGSTLHPAGMAPNKANFHLSGRPDGPGIRHGCRLHPPRCRCPVSSGLCLTLAIPSFIKTGLFSVINSL